MFNKVRQSAITIYSWLFVSAGSAFVDSTEDQNTKIVSILNMQELCSLTVFPKQYAIAMIFIILGIINHLELIFSIWQDVWLQTNTTPFYIRDLNIHRFWYLGAVLESILHRYWATTELFFSSWDSKIFSFFLNFFFF